MQAIRRTAVRGLAAIVVAAAVFPAARAQDSARGAPIRIVVPFTAGSGTDIIARTVGERLEKQLRQTAIVENKPGAGGTLGATQVAAAAPDGNTILVHSAAHVANAALYPNLKYDTLTDFKPVALLATLPNVLVVSRASGIESVGELVARARSKPGAMTYASAGNGSATHINAEKFRLASGVQAVHVPYRGTPEAITDVIAGQVDWFFAPLIAALPLINDGKLVALAVGSPKRSAALPDVPTTLEAGYAGSDFTFWVGMFVPAKTPPDVVNRLSLATAGVLQMPDVKVRFAQLGAEVPAMSQQQFADFVAKEAAAIGALIRQARIKLD